MYMETPIVDSMWKLHSNVRNRGLFIQNQNPKKTKRKKVQINNYKIKQTFKNHSNTNVPQLIISEYITQPNSAWSNLQCFFPLLGSRETLARLNFSAKDKPTSPSRERGMTTWRTTSLVVELFGSKCGIASCRSCHPGNLDCFVQLRNGFGQWLNRNYLYIYIYILINNWMIPSIKSTYSKFGKGQSSTKSTQKCPCRGYVCSLEGIWIWLENTVKDENSYYCMLILVVYLSGWCSTPTLLLFFWVSFTRENDHPLLVCSSRNTA